MDISNHEYLVYNNVGTQRTDMGGTVLNGEKHEREENPVPDNI